jgi:flavin reductase (DIM6/NTAB) family NADH-FMN oxidoreductase RutF
MSKQIEKRDFPVSQVRRYLEPGPIVLVSSKWKGKTNIMTMGWPHRDGVYAVARV